ncbi:unnamed protein product [Jaminaea pallidilutea]
MDQSEQAVQGQRQRRKASSIDNSTRSRLAAWRQIGYGNRISKKEETKDDDEGGNDSNRVDCWTQSSTSPQIDAAYPSTSPPAAAYHVFSTSPASLGSCSSSESAGPSRPPSAASSYSGRASQASSSAVRIQQAYDSESGTSPRVPSPQMVSNGHSRGPSSGSTVSRTRSIGRSHRSPRTDVDVVMSSGPSTPSRPWRARLYGLGVTVDELDSLASCPNRGNSLHHHNHRAVRDSESPVPPVPTWPYARYMTGGNALPALSTSSLPIRYDQQHSPNIGYCPHESSYALGKGKGRDTWRAPSGAQQQQIVSPDPSLLSPPQRSRRSHSVPLRNRSADFQCPANPTTGCENLHSEVTASPRRHSLHTDWIAPHAVASCDVDRPAGAPVVASDSWEVPDSSRLRRSRTSSPRMERHRKVTQGSVHILKYWIGSPSTEARDFFGARKSSDTRQLHEEPSKLQAASDDEPTEELSLDHEEFTGATTPVSPSVSSPDLASNSPSASSSRASISPSTSYRSFAKRSFTALVQAFASSSTSAKDRPPAPARSPSQISWMPMLGLRTEEQRQSPFASPERLKSAISCDAIYSAKGHDFGNPGPAPNAPTGAGDGGSGSGGGSNEGGPPRRGDHHGRRHMGGGSGGSGGGGGGGDRNPGRGPGGGHPRSGSEGSSSSVQSRFKKLELVGRGAYGAVYRGMRLQDNHIVAIKVVNLDTPDDDVSDIQKEIALLTQLRETEQKNIVRYFGCWLKGPELWIVMDYAEGGSVRTLMQAGPISEQYANLIVRETLVALAYLHKAGIIHRDIKAANILLTQQGRILICDFGVAASLVSSASKRTTFVGTPYWMAPEVITSGKSYDQSADIWSLGITVYEMVIGNPPLADQEQMRAIMLIPKNKPPRLPTDKNFSQPMRDFVSSCLNEEAKERPGAEELSKSKWIKSNAKTSTSVLKELIAAYNAWTKAGGMRMSLLGAQAADLDANGDPLSGDRSFDADGDWEFNTFRNDLREHESEEKMAAPLLAAGHGGQRNLALMRLFHPEGESMDESAFGAGVGSSVGHHEENPLVNINPVRPAPAPPPQQQQQHPERPTPAAAPTTETAETASSQQVQAAAPSPAVEKPSFTGTGASPFRFGAPVSSNTAAQQPRAPPVAANNDSAAESGPTAATASATPVPPLATPTRRLASDADLARRFRRGEGAGSHSSSSNEQNAPPLATTHSRNHSIASATSDRSGTYSSHHQPHGSISGQSALFGDFTRPWVTGRSRGSSNGSSTSDLDMPLPTRNNSLPLSSNGFGSSASTSLTGVSPPNMAPPGSTSGWHPPQPSLLGPRSRSGSRSRAGPGSDLGMPQTIAPPLPQQLPAMPNASAAPRDQSGRTPYASSALPGSEGAHSEHFQPGMPGTPFHFGRARHGSTTTRPSPLGLGQVTGPSREAVPTLGSSHNRRQHGGSDPIVPSPKGFPPYEIAEPGSGPTNGVASASAAAAAAMMPHESARRASLVQDGSAGVPGSEEQAGRPIYPLDLSALRSKEEVHAQLERTVDDLSYWLDAVALSLAQQEV